MRAHPAEVNVPFALSEGIKLNKCRFHDCANAVGAAIAKVSGTVDVIKVMEGCDEDEVVKSVCKEAKECAIRAGADPATVSIVELDNMPLQYVQMKASRIVARAVSDSFSSIYDLGF